jgi:hypothetical protein
MTRTVGDVTSSRARAGHVRDGLRAIAQRNVCTFLLSANQNVYLGNVTAANKPVVDKLLLDLTLLKTSSGV